MSRVVIVFGTRTFDNYDLLARKLDYFCQKYTNWIVYSGGARGADRLGEKWARIKRYRTKVFQAEWVQKGPSAGPIRNELMAKTASMSKAFAVAFWDGESPGTRDMILRCRKYNIPLRIVRY